MKVSLGFLEYELAMRECSKIVKAKVSGNADEAEKLIPGARKQFDAAYDACQTAKRDFEYEYREKQRKAATDDEKEAAEIYEQFDKRLHTGKALYKCYRVVLEDYITFLENFGSDTDKTRAKELRDKELPDVIKNNRAKPEEKFNVPSPAKEPALADFIAKHLNK